MKPWQSCSFAVWQTCLGNECLKDLQCRNFGRLAECCNLARLAVWQLASKLEGLALLELWLVGKVAVLLACDELPGEDYDAFSVLSERARPAGLHRFYLGFQPA